MRAKIEEESERARLASKEELAAPLQALPPVQFAFAYGSGVFRQREISESSDRTVDYILGVSSPAQWHSQNIEMNPSHYSSWIAHFGGKAVADAACILGVGVHFNPFVEWRGKVIKYGVVGLSDLVGDILTWRRLYISGRLQKPVCMLVDHSGIAQKNKVNLQAALSTAMLLLPDEFSEEQLYETICGLSYQGDIRLLFAEDKNKVSKIVQGSFSNFRNLYSSSIQQATTSDVLKLSQKDEKVLSSRFSQELGPDAVREHVSHLPSTLLQRLAAKTGTRCENSSGGSVAVADALVRFGNARQRLIKQAVASIVRTSSLKQALSGFIAAGGVNAFRYASRKVGKAWKSCS
ncbi:hypothetical protein SELMODRAFT_118018 [Selaginella moellendorffii]|uniref:Phosphatidate cytidylyltransferase, mitochondrial n=1 Tax=Selaginella moellendorffii TaxID=88036 RepID=D8SJ59_SELML|nr:phosphatidate cytidylyltransferase, mitochondrial [Selaginella moellendorffii]EFJ15740.1 hypothetical protein SELMODRAFT_118018 [Selaginella moellendorffii]|eukprot:XP_002983398.1 phosphatidate cytidylyltransferase, mitochondrial [Selaginella moellendorffii]